MKKSLIFLVCLFYSIGTLFAQDFTASGVVVDESGEEVIGATVVLKGTTTGVATGIDGDFKIKVPHGSTLVFSMVGMKTVERKAADNMRVVMTSDVAALDEVVVTGYGAVKKGSFTGSASVINTESLQDVPTVSLDVKLAGASSGVTVSNASGQPGGVESMRIRGAGSIMASNEPLYVVDGVPLNTTNVSEFTYSQSGASSLSTLNMNDVESITIIKDAGAAAMYGSRAANGVVVIKTKSGRMGKTSVSFRANWGFSNMAIDYRPTLGGDARRELLYYGLENYAKIRGESDPKAFADKNINTFAEKPWSGWADWRDILIKNGSQGNYEASIQTGSEAFNAFSSLAYTKLEGLTAQSGFERFAGRLNTSFTGVRNLRIDVNTTFSRTNQDTYSEGTSYASPIMAIGFTASPQDFPYNEDGTLNRTKKFPLLYSGSANPLSAIEYTSSKNKMTRILGSVGAKYDIYDGLYVKEMLSNDYLHSDQTVWWGPQSNDGRTANGNLQVIPTSQQTFTSQTHLGYIKTFNEVHNIDGLVGYETEKYHYSYVYGSGQGFPNPSKNTLDAATTTSSSGGYEDRRLLSYLAVANYNYNETYYLGANIRRDGSSKFSRNKRWGNFWSLSGSWRLTNENFMEITKQYIQDARIRASYGVNGNLPTNNYDFLSTYTYGNIYAGEQGSIPTKFGNPNLTWEKNQSWNFGLDLSFLNRFNLTLDLYNRKTTDLLVPLAISQTTGFASYNINMGEIRNKGVEVSLRSNNITTNDFTWNTILNLSHNSNKILKLDGERDRMQLGYSNRLMHEVGQPFSMLYALEYAGVDPETGQEQFFKNQGENPRETTTNPAEAKSVLLKKVDPTLSGGLINNLSYKGFDFGFTFTFSLGGHLYDNAAMNWLNTDGGANMFRGNVPKSYDLNKIWKKPGDNAKLPNFYYGNSNQVSSRYMHSTNHLRLKNATLGYNVPRNLLNGSGLSNVRFFASGVNLLTFKSKNLVVDPEIPTSVTNGIGSYGSVMMETPPLRTFTFGVDISF